MYFKKIVKIFSVLFLLSVLFLINQTTTPVFASQANYDLEIIQPRPNLDTTNRFYKAYPGLEYNVRLAVIGGVYPFYHELTTAPAGMTIDSFTGEINWDDPTESGSPHTVVAKVTDDEGTEETVEWTITVTTSGFRFLDAVNGTTRHEGNNEGSYENPWKSIDDFYLDSKNDDTYAGEFLYFRSGTYYTHDCQDLEISRMAMIGNNKPRVWLAYPGESPVIDIRGGNRDNRITFYGTTTHVYFDGFEMQGGEYNNSIIRWTSTAINVVLRRCILDLDNTPGTGSNTSNIMSTNGGSNGYYWAIQDNIIRNTGGDGAGIMGYLGTKVLVENNIVYNIVSHGIFPKVGCYMWFIRGNHVADCATNGINIFLVTTAVVGAGDIEVSYNFIDIDISRRAISIYQYPDQHAGPVHAFRNTFIGRFRVAGHIDEDSGPFYIHNNIIINEEGGDKISYSGTAGDFPERTIAYDNLLGTIADNIVDEEGKLTEAYSEYYGIYGHQTVSSPMTQELNHPKRLRIIVQ